MAKLMNVGFGNVVNTEYVLCILTPDSAPAKRQVQRAKEENRLALERAGLFDVTTNNQIITSALQPDTLTGRFGNTD